MNPKKGNIEKAVLYHQQAFDEVNAQAIAVVWALFAMIYNDMDKWLKIMGSKLEIGLKPSLMLGTARPLKKSRVDKAKEPQKPGEQHDEAMDRRRMTTGKSLTSLTHEWPGTGAPPIIPHPIRDPYANNPLYGLD